MLIKVSTHKDLPKVLKANTLEELKSISINK